MKYPSLLALIAAPLVANTADAQIASTSQSVRSSSTGHTGMLAIDGFPQVVEWSDFHSADEFVDTGFTIDSLTVGSTAALKSSMLPSEGRIRVSGEVTGELACAAGEGGITSSSSNAYFELVVENPGRMLIDGFVQVQETVEGAPGDLQTLLGTSRVTLIHPDGHADVWAAPQPAFSDEGVWVDPGLIDVIDPRRIDAFLALEPGTYELIFTAEMVGTAPDAEVLDHGQAVASFRALVAMAEGPVAQPLDGAVGADEGGAQRVRIDGTPLRAHTPYALLGSATTGSTPLAGGHELPFAIDAYTLAGLSLAGHAAFDRTFGLLDADGTAEAVLRVPADPRLSGLELFHAPVLFAPDGSILGVGNAVSLVIL